MTTLLPRFNYRHEAEQAHGYLESAGIPAFLRIDDASGMEMGLSFSNPAQLYVMDSARAQAGEVLGTAGILSVQ